MTSALQRLQANEDDTIWRENASVIRQLYQDERKTLKELKAIMENDKGFPVTPLQIWEIKLRGLGMQKKLKSKDWYLVYQHLRPRLQHEGKKKLRKPTAVLINNTKKPWDHVWKEIRRNRALSPGACLGPLPPLPHGVIIRTPSPELPETNFRRGHPHSSQSIVLQLFQTTLVSFQPLFELDLQSKADPSDAFECPTPDSVYRLCLEGIPFTMLLDKISDTLTKAFPSPQTFTRLEETQDDRVVSAIGISDNLAMTGETTSWKSELADIMAQLLPASEPAAPSGQDLGTNFDSHHHLSIAIYLLSNNLVDIYPQYSHEVDMCSILETTFTLVSRRFLSVLLQSRLPSIKAAWEKLLRGAGWLMNEEAFRFLIRVGMDNDWLEEQNKGYDYLYVAARMDCLDILRILLGRGCRPHSSPVWCTYGSIIVEALQNGNPDCAKLLIQHCDVNHELQARLYTLNKSTTFSQFIAGFDDTNPDYLDCLGLFLGQGADVDYELDRHCIVPWHHSGRYLQRVELLEEHWPLSILDYLYYFHQPVFPVLAKYCEIPSRFSRTRALWHLDQGVDILREYLASNPEFPTLWGEATGNHTYKANDLERKNRCLEILLAEQFLLSVHKPEVKSCWKAVEGLSQLEIDLTWLSQTKGLAASMLYATAHLITFGEDADKKKGVQTLQWLLDQGFQVKSDALVAASDNAEDAVLKCLALNCNSLEKEGGEALVRAVQNDKFDAIKRLLDMGADPNIINYEGINVFEQAACTSSLGMMKYLVQRGAKPRTSEQGNHPSHALMKMLQTVHYKHIHDMFNKVQYITEKHIKINEPSCQSANLLEACFDTSDIKIEGDTIEQRRTVFEFLLKKGARVSPGSPLAVWIASGGGHQLSKEMLDAGADTNSHSLGPTSMTPLQAAAGIGDYTLVRMLMERGANLNRPALAVYSKTALQAICSWDPVRREERMRKDEIIKLLLDEGVDVNASSSTGQTALHFASELGDLSTAFILLKHKAMPNAISTWYRRTNGGHGQTALDVAANFGRLDMVEFLLNANALSSSAFSQGNEYGRAIEWARQSGHFVVSELICKHAADRKRWDVSHEQAVARSIPLEHTPQSLSQRAKLETASWSHDEGQLRPSENLHDNVVPDQINGSSYMLDEDTIESGTAASKAKGKGNPRAEATDMGWNRVIEEIEDELPLVDACCERPNGENSAGDINQTTGAEKASSGSGGWLYRPTDQNWVEDEQQNVGPLVTSSLTADAFMGFSESPSL